MDPEPCTFGDVCYSCNIWAEVNGVRLVDKLVMLHTHQVIKSNTGIGSILFLDLTVY